MITLAVCIRLPEAVWVATWPIFQPAPIKDTYDDIDTRNRHNVTKRQVSYVHRCRCFLVGAAGRPLISRSCCLECRDTSRSEEGQEPGLRSPRISPRGWSPAHHTSLPLSSSLPPPPAAFFSRSTGPENTPRIPSTCQHGPEMFIGDKYWQWNEARNGSAGGRIRDLDTFSVCSASWEYT